MINYGNPYNNPIPQQGANPPQDQDQEVDMSALDKGWFKCYKIALYL